MRLTRRIPLTFLAVLLLLLTAASPALAQSGEDQRDRKTTNVKFYGHVFGHGLELPMPANVEPPVGEDMYGLGSSHTCTSQVHDGEDGPQGGCDAEDINKLVLYSTAGFVDVSSRSDFGNNGGYGMLHNERGQTKPILLDTTKSIETRIFMTVDDMGWFVAGGDTNCMHPHPQGVPCAYPYWGWDPGARPHFQVKAKLYHAQLGDWKASAAEAPPVEDVLESGEPTLVAEGQWGPDQVVNGLPGQSNVNEFVIDLGKPQVDTIPKTHDFFLVYSFYNEANGQQYATGDWRVWAGEFFPPYFTLPVKNAFDVEAVIPNFVHGKLVMLGVISTPWGSYDVNPDATKLTITDEAGSEVTPASLKTFADYSVAHGGHFKPANVTYVWDYMADGLEPGTYTVTVSAENFQGSASAECSAEFTVGKNGKPGPTEPGRCGFQTLTEEQRQKLEEGAQEQADEEGKRALGAPAPLPDATPLHAAMLLGLVLVPGRRLLGRRDG